MEYSIKKIDDLYYLLAGEEILTTPQGEEVRTLYLPLAERMLNDLKEYGYNFFSSASILPWHFTMLDNFSKMEHEDVEDELSNCFIHMSDWTFSRFSDDEWLGYFGEWENRLPQIEDWLCGCTIMQMTAVCCIGNTYETINLAYVLASIMEKYEGAEREEKFKKIAELCARDFRNGTTRELMNDFKTFELYYGFHLKENGPIINKI